MSISVSQCQMSISVSTQECPNSDTGVSTTHLITTQLMSISEYRKIHDIHKKPAMKLLSMLCLWGISQSPKVSNKFEKDYSKISSSLAGLRSPIHWASYVSVRKTKPLQPNIASFILLLGFYSYDGVNASTFSRNKILKFIHRRFRGTKYIFCCFSPQYVSKMTQFSLSLQKSLLA